jgi:hypothetical protein
VSMLSDGKAQIAPKGSANTTHSNHATII